MTQLAKTPPILAERVEALADLTRAMAQAPDATEVARQAAAALRRSFPAAGGIHLHALRADRPDLVSMLGGPDPLSSCPPARAALRRAARENTPLSEPLPARGEEPPAVVVIAPVVYGATSFGTLALTLPDAAAWPSEDAQWLDALAGQVGLGLAQAHMREAHIEAERYHREMNEAVEARAQARVEQLTGRGRQLEALFQLSSQISMTLDEARVTAMALDHLVSLTASRFGFVAMVDPAGALELGCVRGVGEKERESLRVALSGLRELVDLVSVSRRPMRQNQGTSLPAVGDSPSLRLDSLLGVPLSSGNRPFGALVLVGRLPGYDEADERLVSMFGSQLAVAVQNARMVAKIEGSLQTRRRELTSLSRTAQELASTADETQVLERVVAIIDDTFDARAAWVMLRDAGEARAGAEADRRHLPPAGPGRTPGGEPLRLRHHRGVGQELLPQVVPDDQGIVGETLQSLLPVFKGELRPDDPVLLPSGKGQSRTPPPRWRSESGPVPLLCVPLVVQDQALGVLCIDSARFSAWRPPQPEDLDLIQAFASQAAVAIENARLMGAAVRRTRRERLLNEILDAVREPMGVGEILNRAVERLGVALEVNRCVALLPEENGEYHEHVWAEAGFELPADETLWESCPSVQRLEETGQPLVLADASSLPRFCQPPDAAVPPRSLLGIPALRGEEANARGQRGTSATGGVLFLFHQCDRTREWSVDDLSLAQRVVAQVAVAVENAHLYAQELKREQFQRTMAEIATAVGSSVELNQVLRAVGEQGMRLLSADAAYIWRLDDASREMVSAAAVGHKADKFQNLRLALTRRSFHVVRAAIERRPVAAHGIGLDRQASQRLNRMFDCQSLLAVPLLLREKVIGVVQFSTTGAGTRFDEHQVAQAEILVSQAAAAVENAQLYEAERGRAEELEVLWRFGQETAENLQPEPDFTSIVAGARQMLGVEAVSLLLFGEDDGTLAIAAQEGLSAEHVAAVRFRRGERIPRCIAVDGAHRLTLSLTDEPHYPPVAVQDKLQSMLSVPMQDGTQIAGALSVYSSRRRHFSVEEAQKLDLLASFAMAALRQARQLRREQKIAQAFQRDLLPELKPSVAGFDVARKSIAALTTEADVGGDFYDVHPISESKIGLVIGDVAGKGLAAAPHRTMVKCVLRAFALETPSPGPVLERLNRLLFRTMDSERFVTLFYGVLDVVKGELTYANAGHELPLVLRRGSGSPELLETTGPLLGFESDSRYRQVCTRISTGDTLVMYTDGFTEARRGNDFLQVEGLASLLGEFREGSADDMVESVSQSVRKNYDSLRDDATILVVKSIGTRAE